MTAPGPRSAAATAEEINAALHSMIGAVPCLEIGWGWAVVGHDIASQHLRHGDTISGQTIFTLCDAALFYSGFSIAGLEPMALTNELSMRFLRAGREGVIRARGVVDKPGRRSIVSTVRVWTDDESRPLAVAQGTLSLPG